MKPDSDYLENLIKEILIEESKNIVAPPSQQIWQKIVQKFFNRSFYKLETEP